MIVTDKESYIQGSSALAPKVTTNDDRRKNNKKKKKFKINKNKITKNKLKIIRNIFIVFVVGVIVIGRYTKIYNLQEEANMTSSNINKLNKENENLRVELVKYSNIQYIEELATNKLKMVKPNKESLVYCDLNKEVVKYISHDKENNKEKSNNGKIKRFFSKLF